MKTIIYSGHIITPTEAGEISSIHDGALAVENEKIIYVGAMKQAIKQFPNAERVEHPQSILLPGMIDMHTHLPQYDAIGNGKGTLLEWLEEYIFPTEGKFFDLGYAKIIAKKFFHEIISHGTTTAVIFGPAQKEAASIAFEEAENAGIRLFMGKTMMDIGNNELISSAEQNIDDTIYLANQWHGKHNGLLNYVLLPRYAGSCSMQLMKKSAEISVAENLILQTHLAENLDELIMMKQLFPNYKTYLEIYKAAGIYGKDTQFVHCIYLSEDEKNMLARDGTALVHCPVSNRYLQSGIMPLAEYLDMGVPTGLGTDIAAGYSFSILNEAREAIETSKIYNTINKTDHSLLNAEKAFCMATIDAAKILKIDKVTGCLEVGKEADFIVIDPSGKLNSTDEKSTSKILEKIIYRHQDMQIINSYIRGRPMNTLQRSQVDNP